MTTEAGTVYRGRFAPSPTGPLHQGSLVAAIASYLQASVNNGCWLLRIENIDPPRAEAGAIAAIERALDIHGFRWHGPVRYQNDRIAESEAIVARLLAERGAYACKCSRDQIRTAARAGPLGPVYPGTCRDAGLATDANSHNAIRVRATGVESFTDGILGPQRYALERDVGDFIIRRKDRFVAYHLAVVVDDAREGITEVVRGADLLASTAPQRFLQRCLGYPHPAYCHVPVVTNAAGTKLSKQTGAPPLDNASAAANLVAGLNFLNQAPPRELSRASVDEVWSWARANWRLARIAGAA